MKTWIVGTGLGALLLAGGIAVAAPDGGAHRGMHRGGMHGADANGDGTVTRAELTAQMDQHFAKVDTDGDGRITQAEREAKRAARADEHFKRLDADGNGQISRAEFDAAREKRQAIRGERAEKMGKAGEGRRWQHRGGRGMMDADKDGTVTKTEFQARAFAMFDRLDTNKDGQVTQQEREAGRAAWKAKRQQR